jgi:hypothetical protein
MIEKTDIQKIECLIDKIDAVKERIRERIFNWNEKEFIVSHPIGTQIEHSEKAEYFSLVDEAESILLTSTTIPDKDREFEQKRLESRKETWKFYCSPNMCRMLIVTKNINNMTSLKEGNEMIDRLIKILRDNREPPNSRVATVMDQSEFSSIVDEIRTIDHMFHG